MSRESLLDDVGEVGELKSWPFLRTARVRGEVGELLVIMSFLGSGSRNGGVVFRAASNLWVEPCRRNERFSASRSLYLG